MLQICLRYQYDNSTHRATTVLEINLSQNTHNVLDDFDHLQDVLD